jgi:tetratricopeptide (TPR) repeat protein
MKDALLGVGLKAEAEIVLRTGLKAFPQSGLLRIYLADVLSGTGRSAEALGILDAASRLSTDRQQRAVIFQRIGSIQLGLAHLDEAFRAYRQALEIAPESTEGRIQLGKAYFDSNRWKKRKVNLSAPCAQRRTTRSLISVYRQRISRAVSGKRRRLLPSAQ